MTLSNLFYILLFILIIAATAVIIESVSLKNDLNKEILRRIFYLITVSVTALLTIIIPDESFILLISIAVLVTAFISFQFSFLSTTVDSKTKNWGLLLFAIAYLLLALIIPGKRETIFLSLLILALSGSIAPISATLKPVGVYHISGERKSLSASITFFLLTFLILITFHFANNFGGNLSLLYFVSVAILISFILTIIDTLSSHDFDKLYIPIFSAILLELLLRQQNDLLIVNFFIGLSIAVIVSILSFKAKFLTLSGSIATLLLAGFIFGLGGLQWSVPIMTFFILSSLLSKYRKRKNEDVELFFEKTGVRDHWQVAANGGIGGILVIINAFYPSSLNYLIYLASLAAVCADTWATEIGTLKPANTYNILNFKSMEQGVSGGISIIGTFGSFLGAVVIALSGIYWVQIDIYFYFMIIVLAGVLGSFFDSFLGASFQVQFECVKCGKITERKIHCGKNTIYNRGVQWLNNDFVNLLSAIFGIIIVIILNGVYG